MPVIDKDRPAAEWIRAVRGRYVCEAEVDRVLTRKLERRAHSRYSPVSLDLLSSAVRALLEAELDGRFELSNPRWLSGGASKLQMVFDLTWDDPERGRGTIPLVLRMETAESVVESSRLREFQLLKAFEGIVPLPRPRWIDAAAKHLPYPGLVYDYVPGVTKPTGVSSNVTGVGISFGPELREKLAPQFVRHLSAIHTHDWRGADLGAFDVPDTATRAVEWQIAWWERVWEEDSNEDVPLLRLAAAWLRDHVPAIDHLSIVHGDYRSGNFLFTEEDGRISAWLDWELGHLGDRHEDFGWMLASFSRQPDERGRSLVCGLLPDEDLFEAYEKASGLPLHPKTLAFYRVLNTYKAAVIPTATAYRAARGGKTHQDVLLAWFLGIGYTLLGDLRELLEEVA